MLSPRIGMNELGMYSVEPSALKRNMIIKKEMDLEKRPPSFYDPARRYITEALLQGLTDLSTLAEQIEKLRSESETGWKKKRNELSADAIEAFMTMQREVDLEHCMPFPAVDTSGMYIKDVLVRSKPELLLRHMNTRDKATLGGIKLYMNKNSPLSVTLNKKVSAGKISATLLARQIEQYSHFATECNYLKCQVVDVFAGEVFRASKEHKIIWKYIEAGCNQIKDGWGTQSA